jgi:peptide-methionine (S)-S-oxide reductase
MLRRALLGAAMLALAACQQPALASEEPLRAPVSERVAAESTGNKTTIFAGGCFWGVEGVFSHVKGVTSAVSGYHGGDGSDATYGKVSAGGTGHAEAVKVTYDPSLVRYDQLLRIFFSVVVDPTQLNRQGPDSGLQYRSAIVPLSEEQRRVASAYLAQLKASGLWDKPIVTRLERYRKFHAAEASHQDFMVANPRHPYILRWDAPKVKALKAYFPGLYRASFQKG